MFHIFFPIHFTPHTQTVHADGHAHVLGLRLARVAPGIELTVAWPSTRHCLVGDKLSLSRLCPIPERGLPSLLLTTTIPESIHLIHRVLRVLSPLFLTWDNLIFYSGDLGVLAATFLGGPSSKGEEGAVDMKNWPARLVDRTGDYPLGGCVRGSDKNWIWTLKVSGKFEQTKGTMRIGQSSDIKWWPLIKVGITLHKLAHLPSHRSKGSN
ncbi:hypothetical protein B0H10DRAFT_1950786 [Mycena sp. CBHHK59/15]|nr:hypothetical protein B0H10DRAFT_1950786 [Mycena sp. CBHHK59/15]